MKDKWAKWSRYEIGNIHFVNGTKGHPHRSRFVDFVVDIGATSVLEIGPGELLEYQNLRQRTDIDYTIIDVSKLFLKNCKDKFPEVHQHKCSMDNLDTLGFKKGEFDISYCSSVLEHSPNVIKTIKSLIEVSKNFQFVMFKWSYSGSLKSEYHPNKKYWSTSFNIHKLLKAIEEHGKVTSTVVAMKETGEIIDFDEYSEGLSGNHRSGNYLVITGVSG